MYIGLLLKTKRNNYTTHYVKQKGKGFYQLSLNSNGQAIKSNIISTIKYKPNLCFLFVTKMNF